MPPTASSPSAQVTSHGHKIYAPGELETALSEGKKQRYVRSAQMLMQDALKIVETDHKGSIKNYFKNAASTGLRTLSTGDKVSIATGAALTVGVLVATLATGGLALPLLIGLGAAGYALKKAIEEVSADRARSNRNWLQRFPSATSANNKEQATFLTCEAGDALRRAVDHYRMMVNTIIPNELKPQDEGQYSTCDDVINHVKAVARFIHHGDKVRNYTLPVLDMLIFYLEQYDELAKKWAAWEPDFRRDTIAWFAAHPSGCCAVEAKHVCYAQTNRAVGFRDLHKPHPNGDTRSALPPIVEFVSASGQAVEISELVEAMKKARQKVIDGMHQSSSTTWNYSAERPATARVRDHMPAEEHMRKRRLDMLIDAVWKDVDRPGRMARAGRRIEHWYTRHNKTEKLGSVMSEMLSVGSIFLPFLKGADALTELGKSAVSASVSATATIGDKVGISMLKSAGKAPVTCGLLSHDDVKKSAEADIRGSGITIQKLMPKVMLHFSKAAQAIETLGTSREAIKSCTGAFGYAILAAEVIHEMEKVGRYLGPCIGIVDLLANACDKWAAQEDEVWRDMEAYVGEWIRDDEVHQACRDAGTKCYGAKHIKVGASFLGRGGVWHHLTNDPHNPL